MKNKKDETHKMQHEEGVINGIVINRALPYCAKDKKTFLEGLKASNECEYGENDLFVNYDGKQNVFVEHYSLKNNKSNNKTKRGRIIFMQHGLDGPFRSEKPEDASNQYVEFESMVKKLKGQTAKNGFKFESLGIITKRQNSINKIKDKNTYLFFNDAMDKQKSEKLGIDKLIYEKTKDKNILIRTEFSTGQSSFENQLNEMAKIVSILGIIDDEVDVTFIGDSIVNLKSQLGGDFNGISAIYCIK